MSVRWPRMNGASLPFDRVAVTGGLSYENLYKKEQRAMVEIWICNGFVVIYDGMGRTRAEGKAAE